MQKLLETLKQISLKVEEIKTQQKDPSVNKELLSLSEEKILSKQEELTEYINKIFEQQERERIVRWIVNSIRESLDLNEVLRITVEEVGKLLKVDRCLVALFNNKNLKFELKSQYRLNDDVKSMMNTELLINESVEWYRTVIINHLPIIINDSQKDKLTSQQKEYYQHYGTKSALTIPIIYKKEILGVFSIQQTQNTREWEDTHIEILKDIGSQLAVAIRQAELYLTTKKQAEREKFLSKIISTIRSTFDIDEILKIICEEVANIFEVERIVIVEFPSTGNHDDWLTRREYTTDETVKISNTIICDRRFGEYWGKNLIKGTTIAINNVYDYKAPEFFKQTYELIGGKSVLASPIKKGDKVWGTIVLVKVNDFKHWTEEEISLIETISDQVYLAIQQAEFYLTTKKQAEREISLRKIMSTIRSTLDIDTTLQAICDEIAKLFNVDSANIVEFLDRETHIEWKVRKEYKANKNILGLQNVLNQQAAEYIVQNYYLQGHCFVVDNIYQTNIPDFLRELYEMMGVKSIIASPIKTNEKVWGAIGLLIADNYRQWTEEEISLLETITDQIYIAIQQAELYSTTKKQAERESLLRKITDTIRSSLDINEIKNTFVNEVGKTFNADRCFIGIFDHEKDDFDPIDSYSEYLSVLEIKSFIGRKFDEKIDEYMKKVCKKNQPTIFPDADNLEENTEYNKADLKSFFLKNNIKSSYGFPIFNDGQLIGTFVIQYLKRKVKLKPDEIELLKTVVNQTGIAIKQAELYITTKKQAEREHSLRKGITTIRSSLDINEVLNIICSEISKIFNVQRVSIRDFKEDVNDIAILAEYTFDETYRSAGDEKYLAKTREFWTKKLAKTKTSIALDNIYESDTPDYFKKTYKIRGTKSILAIPIKKGDQVWGGLFLSEYSQFRKWTQEETDLLMAIADQVSIAISQARLYYQTQQATRLKSEFLANMSHEFRTPLNAIIGFSEMLLSNNYGILSNKQEEYLSNISISGKHLLRLVNDILDLSKIESGNMELYYEKFSIKEVIEETITIIKDIAVRNNVSIELQLDNIIISADILRLKQIMYNLLSNAVKFTKNNGKVTVRTKIKNSNVRVEVEDTGIGISKQNRDKIFLQFRQIDSSYSRKQEGTGLGLVLTKKLVEMHGGTIDFKSIENEGTIFWFKIPISKDNI